MRRMKFPGYFNVLTDHKILFTKPDLVKINKKK